MRTLACSLVGFLVIASSTVADAQSGRVRGDKTANWDQIESANPSGPRIARRDVEAFSGIGVLVSRRKDLKVSDEQLRQLKELSAAEAQALGARLATFDSLRMALRPRAGANADEEQARLAVARRAMMEAVAAVREAYDSTLTAALPVLSETQQGPARELVHRELSEAEERFREKLRGPRPMPERPSPGRRP